MKRNAFWLIALLASAQAIAGDTANIDFDVTAEAASCTPTLSNNGVVDYGTNHAGDLHIQSFTQLGTRDITLTIQCESSTGVAITARDTRSDSAVVGKDDNGQEGARFQINGGGYVHDKARLFGLGLTAEKKPIGSYAIQINAASVVALDGSELVSVDIGGSASTEGPWEAAAPIALPTNQDFFYTFLKKGTTTPQPVSTATVPLQVSASIANQLNSSQTVSLDGSAVISIVYL